MNNLNIIFQSKKRRPLVLLTYNQRYIEVQSHAYNSHMILVIARDITDMIHLLNSRQKFLSNINHELRTPLTVLQGYLEILADNNIQNPLQKGYFCNARAKPTNGTSITTI